MDWGCPRPQCGWCNVVRAPLKMSGEMRCTFFFMHFGMGKVVGRLEVKELKIWGTKDSDSTREEEGGLPGPANGWQPRYDWLGKSG